MGFENRDYYREDEGGGFTLTGGIGTACKTLIAVNIAVFLLQILTMNAGVPAANHWLSFDAAALMSGQVWRIFTWGFGFQGHPLGFIFDMLFIWWFGKSIESMYGTRELFLYYGAAILIGSGVGLILALATNNNVTLIGSSIPSMAITVLFAWHFPYRQILLFFLLPVPIFAIVAFYVVMNLFAAASAGGSGGPFIAGLVAGVAFGLLYGWQDWRIEKLLPGQGVKLSLPRRKPKLHIYEPEDQNEVDREVDRILAKIHDQGEGSLTDQERKTLQQASRRYRK